MTNPLIQIDDVVREMTDDELEAHEAIQAELQAVEEAKAQTKASALAKLAALGLTEEEIAAL
jgi:hypothetical protein